MQLRSWWLPLLPSALLLSADTDCADGTCPNPSDPKYSCAGWKQTGGCSPEGPREANGDKQCHEMVPGDASGFCECGDGSRVRKVGCGHSLFKCEDECLWQDRYTCLSWRQTGGCSADGEREPDRDRDCAALIDAGASGYCECGAGRRVRKPGCKDRKEADDFICREECEAAVGMYEELELEAGAPIADVKRAFRKLSVKYHPDKTGDDPLAISKFHQIRQAYEVLGDGDLKMLYDTVGWTPDDGKKPEKANKMRGDLAVPLAHLFNGAAFTTYFSRKVICPGCSNQLRASQRCSLCNAQCPNEIKVQQVQMGPFLTQQRMEVPSKERCKEEHTPLEVEVEQGMPDGHLLQFPLMGEQRPKMMPGDLEMKLSTEKHPLFTRKGHDLTMNLEISLKEALLGFNHSFEHLDKRTVWLNSSDISSPQQVIELPGEGMPRLHSPSERGKLKIKLTVLMPTKLEQDQRDWLKQHFPGPP